MINWLVPLTPLLEHQGLFNTLIAYRQLESDSQLQKDLVAGGWRHCSLKSTEHEVYNDGGCLENGRKRAV